MTLWQSVCMAKAQKKKRNIRLLREERDWTQADVAAKLNRTANQVSRWETGERGLKDDVLQSLSELYEVPVDVLLKWDGEGLDVEKPSVPSPPSDMVKIDRAMQIFELRLKALSEKELMPFDEQAIGMLSDLMRRKLLREDSVDSVDDARDDVDAVRHYHLLKTGRKNGN